MVFILRVSLSVFNCKGISVYIEHLKILESGFFISSSSKVGYNFLEALDKVVAGRKNVQFCAIMQPIEDHDFVIVE